MDKIALAKQILQEQENTISTLEQNITELSRQLQQLKVQQNELYHIIAGELNKKESPEKPEKSESKKQTEANMARELNKAQKKVIQLKNGQVNIPFQEKIKLEEFGIPQGSNIKFEGIEQLNWQAAQGVFEGTPQQAGEFIGVFKYHTDPVDNNGVELEKEVHFLVNPDPRTLWQSIDPPEEAPYYKPNTDFTFKTAAGKIATALSVRGKSHAHKGSFREDHMLINCHNKNWIIQVVADGAGSAKYSRQGSKIACEATSKCLSDYLDSDKLEILEKQFAQFTLEQENQIHTSIHHEVNALCTNAARHAHEQIKEFAHDEGQNPKAFASTLLFSLTKTFEFGTVVIAFSIGDGAMAVIDEKHIKPLMIPDGGEYSGQTRFITMPELFAPEGTEDLNKRVHMALFQNYKATILMTDGVSDPKFGTDNKLKDPTLWQNLWDELESILSNKTEIQENLVNWLDFYLPGEYDDRTISILT